MKRFCKVVLASVCALAAISMVGCKKDGEEKNNDGLFAGNYVAVSQEEIENFADKVVFLENMEKDCLTNNGGIEFSVKSKFESFLFTQFNLNGEGNGKVLSDKAAATFIKNGEENRYYYTENWWYTDGGFDEVEEEEDKYKNPGTIDEIFEMIEGRGMVNFSSLILDFKEAAEDFNRYEWLIDETDKEYTKIKINFESNTQSEDSSEVVADYQQIQATYVFDKDYKIIAFSIVHKQREEGIHVAELEYTVLPFNGEVVLPNDLDAYEKEV